MTDVEIVDDRIDSVVGHALVTTQWAELMARYGMTGADDGEVLRADDFAPPLGGFVVARLDGTPVGCAGVRRHGPGADRVAELKRMYVDPTVRRRGIAARLLAAAEARARDLGYRRLVLETGILQPEAIALYERDGYQAIPAYGAYADLPVIRCYAKDL